MELELHAFMLGNLVRMLLLGPVCSVILQNEEREKAIITVNTILFAIEKCSTNYPNANDLKRLKDLEIQLREGSKINPKLLEEIQVLQYSLTINIENNISKDLLPFYFLGSILGQIMIQAVTGSKTLDKFELERFNLSYKRIKFPKHIDEKLKHLMKISKGKLTKRIADTVNEITFEIQNWLQLSILEPSVNEINLGLLDQSETMIVSPIWQSREFHFDDKLCFVLMPLTKKWTNRIWETQIKPIVDKCGLKAIKADNLYGHIVMEDIWKGINQAKVIIADITGKNPNVFYELGIAHTLGKNVVLLTQSEKDIPFDLRPYRCIIYEDNADGYDKLRKELPQMIMSICKKA